MKKRLLNLCGLFCASLMVCSSLKAQTGLHFDSTDDYVQTDYAGVLGDKARTVEAWVKTDSNGNEQIIATWGSDAASGQRFTFRLNPSGSDDVIRIEIKGGGFNGSVNVNDGAWHHVAVTYDPTLSANKYKLYVDGVLDTESDISTTLNTTVNTDLIIGRRINPSFGGFFSGTIDELRVWDVARTQTEIQNAMNSEICNIPTSLKVYFKFEDGVPAADNSALTSISDSSGNNYVGVLNDFTLTATTSNFVTGATISSSLDTTISLTNSDSTLSVAVAGVTYQWLDCNNGNSPIANETNQDFTPTSSGSYAVEVTANGCTVISNCFDFVLPCAATVVTNYPFVETFEDDSNTLSCWTQIYEVGTADWTLAEGLTQEILPPHITEVKTFYM